MRPQIRQVDETVDLAKHVIVGDMPLEAEAVEQRLLHHPPLAHHRPNLLFQREQNQRQRQDQAEFFNAIRQLQPSAARKERALPDGSANG